MRKKRTYYVLMANLRDSRWCSTTRRLKIQLMMRDSIEIANLVFKKVLSCPLSFSRGDAIECLSKDKKSLLACVLLLRGLMWRVPMRFAIGEGEWNICMMKGDTLCDVNQQDGRVFWDARDMLEEAKRHSLLLNARATTNSEKELIKKIEEIGDLSSYEEVNRYLRKNLRYRLSCLSFIDRDCVMRLLETFRWNNNMK